LLVPAVVVAALCSSQAAFAATGGHAAPVAKSSPAEQKTTQRGMNLAGFNAAVAKAHGYKIVTYTNGDQQSVPIDPSSHLPKSPILHRATTVRPLTNTDYNESRGNCGTAWIRISQIGKNKVTLVSGFKNAPSPAFEWNWNVSLTDSNGTSHQVLPLVSQAIAGTSAAHIWPPLNQYGQTYDFVDGGSALLVDGGVCIALRPDVFIAGLNS
jgi:hypothetical protein